LRGKGLDDRITVKKTGCMGRCKSAPNLVVLPGKNSYKCFKEEKINTLIDTHFLSQ
jgi:(2Fe-2S) ferredoxin